jgi:hypothetical protein
MLKSVGKLPIIVYSKRTSARLIYTLDFFFSFFDIDYLIKEPKEQIDSLFSIEYGGIGKTADITIEDHGILFEESIQEQDISLGKWEGLTTLFHSENGDIPFDIFSSVFFLISRYEEYLHHEKDEHGRYKAENSIAFKNNFIDIPLVDLWVKKFYEIYLKPKDVKWVKSYKFTPTFDIDIAYSFKGKGIKINTGRILLDLLKGEFKEAKNRIFVLLNKDKDPYDNYDYLGAVIKNNKSIFFFQVGEKGRFDKNLNPKHPLSKELINRYSANHKIGIHPSYRSFLNLDEIKKEKKCLESISGINIELSRQHFLKLQVPESLIVAEKAGIKTDFSLGYSNKIGFRSSTSHKHTFFDLNNNAPMKIFVQPLIIMDVALYRLAKGDYKKAIEISKKTIDLVKEVDGNFVSLWHNNTILNHKDWLNWEKVFEFQMKHSIAE